MKKYVVINKTTKEVFGKYDTRIEAGECLLRHLKNNLGASEFLSPFDFEVNEEDVQISSYEDAVEFLGIKDIYKAGEIKTVETTPKHYKALLALSKLFVIAEAWNKEDRFVPDFSNENQSKFFPWFMYYNKTKRFVCVSAYWSVVDAPATVGTQLCFATRERAFDFGKRFESLYNDFLMIK